LLDHLIVAVADKRRSAELLGGLLGLAPSDPSGPFAPVVVNEDLTFDFDDRFGAQPGHYAFRVDDDVFDNAVQRAVDLGLEWGSAPRVSDGRFDTTDDGRRVYIRDPDGVAYEFITTP
jgi:catechol 2,3-dioxygenase-like lactoylglutathione lyase family enzyme